MDKQLRARIRNELKHLYSMDADSLSNEAAGHAQMAAIDTLEWVLSPKTCATPHQLIRSTSGPRMDCEALAIARTIHTLDGLCTDQRKRVIYFLRLHYDHRVHDLF